MIKAKKYSFYYSILRKTAVLLEKIKVIVVINNNNNTESNYSYHLTTGMKSRKIISR